MGVIGSPVLVLYTAFSNRSVMPSHILFVELKTEQKFTQYLSKWTQSFSNNVFEDRRKIAADFRFSGGVSGRGVRVSGRGVGKLVALSIQIIILNIQTLRQIAKATKTA